MGGNTRMSGKFLVHLIASLLSAMFLSLVAVSVSDAGFGSVFSPKGPGIGEISGPPSNTALPEISGTPHVGQTLSCSQGSWSYDPTSFSYRWQNESATISGAVSSTYTLVEADAGSTISCRVTATNAQGSGLATSSAVNVIGVPSNSTRPIISGIPLVGQELSCSQGSWDNNPTAYTYQWRRGGSPISGATNSTHTLTGADAGRPIRCRVTAANDAGSDSSTSVPVRVPHSSSAAPPESDTTAPVTTIDSGPAAAVREMEGIFTFHASELGVGFECRVDTRSWGPCSSPQVVYGLTVGSHTFQVRAQDWAGNTGDTASWNWAVDRKAPKLNGSNIKKKKKNRKGRRIRKAHLAYLSGLVGDDYDDVKRVKVKLKVVNPRKKSKKGTCASLSLKTGRRIVNKCKWGFTKVKGTRRWKITLSRKVRSGLKSKDHYRLMIRTLDSAGNHKTYGVPFRVQ